LCSIRVLFARLLHVHKQQPIASIHHHYAALRRCHRRATAAPRTVDTDALSLTTSMDDDARGGCLVCQQSDQPLRMCGDCRAAPCVARRAPTVRGRRSVMPRTVMRRRVLRLHQEHCVSSTCRRDRRRAARQQVRRVGCPRGHQSVTPGVARLVDALALSSSTWTTIYIGALVLSMSRRWPRRSAWSRMQVSFDCRALSGRTRTNGPATKCRDREHVHAAVRPCPAGQGPKALQQMSQITWNVGGGAFCPVRPDRS
jgi:hypothetical protein